MEGGKIVAEFPNYRHTVEISGGKLVEVSSQVSRLFWLGLQVLLLLFKF